MRNIGGNKLNQRHDHPTYQKDCVGTSEQPEVACCECLYTCVWTSLSPQVPLCKLFCEDSFVIQRALKTVPISVQFSL